MMLIKIDFQIKLEIIIIYNHIQHKWIFQK